MIKHLRLRLLLTLAILAGTLAGCTRPAAFLPLDTLILGVPGLEQSGLIYLAAERGLFAQHRLDVVVRDFTSGPAALDALTAGTVDIAGAAEYPFVRALLAGQPLTALATIDKFENDYVVARPDRGIAGPLNLRGKRVGLMRGTIVEFYLARLLELHAIPSQDVTVVDLKADQVTAALAAGEVDAIVTWQPYVAQAQAAVSGAVVLPVQSSQPAFGLLIGRQSWVDQHPEQLARFFEALHEAEDQLVRHPDTAQDVVRRRLGYAADYLAAVWPQHRFGLSLDQPLVIAMKDEAQWLVRSQLAPAGSRLDFTAHIDSGPLEAVKPGAVTLFR